MRDSADVFLAFSDKVMETAQKQIKRCLDQLTEKQLWQRGSSHENSIANLLLHLEGNLRQWFLHGIDKQPDVRERDGEFATNADPEAPKAAEIQSRFYETIAECRKVIAALPSARLLETINPQPGGGWGEPAILEAIYQVVGHLQMHTGQIILLTKQMVGHDLDLTIPRKR